jgi:hypothetical protein
MRATQATAIVGSFLLGVCTLPSYRNKNNVGISTVVNLSGAGE